MVEFYFLLVFLIVEGVIFVIFGMGMFFKFFEKEELEEEMRIYDLWWGG